MVVHAAREVGRPRRVCRAASANCQFGCLTQRLDEAALVRDAFSGDIEGGAVIHGGPHDRQANGDIYAGLQPEHLYRPWPWS